MADPLEAELLDAVDSVMRDVPEHSAQMKRDLLDLNLALGGITAVIVLFLILATVLDSQIAEGLSSGGPNDPKVVAIEWGEPKYLPRHEECIDPNNGQDPGYEGYGVGYEPSLSIDSQGNLFVTAHKDLRWGGDESPIAPIFGGDPGLWYACSEGDSTTWDYWASWFWISNDGGTNWSHGADFNPTPGNQLQANYLAGGSECLGDEGDISVDANDKVYYLDTTLEDNWWHVFTDGGNTYEMGTCQRMNTMAADDRPWVAAQGDSIIHYLGNSGAPPPECTLDSGRYWYYHSENGGTTFSQCYSMPGGWSTIASQRTGPYVYVAQENADSATGHVQIRISPDYGRGTGVTDGSWQAPVDIGPRNGNCPEGYPVVNTNEQGTVAVTWADCPSGGTGGWNMYLALSYDYGVNWSTWNITPFESGINMYPFVSISEEDIISIAFYGLDFQQSGSEDGYVAGKEWYLYAAALRRPQMNDTFEWSIADPTPLHTVTEYEEGANDVHALHDFFETVLSPEGDWLGIAYQQNVGQHPFEDNEEQRYIKFVRGELDV